MDYERSFLVVLSMLTAISVVLVLPAVNAYATVPMPKTTILSRYKYDHFSIMRATVSDNNDDDVDVVDIAIVGAGIAGLTAGAILNTLYGKKVGVYESHYLPGGCAHAFERTTTTRSTPSSSSSPTTFTFDSGPTILLGCSQRPFNALRQVLDSVSQSVNWIRYDGWGMIEWPDTPTGQKSQQQRRRTEKRWKCELGPDRFQKGPLLEYGGPEAVEEFEALRTATKDLVVGAAIPAMAMRPGPTALIPLLKYFPTLIQLLQQGEVVTGTFDPFMNGPKFHVKNEWLRNWLDALAFSLSGLPASRTSAAAMAFVLDDMHKEGAALDYPAGGLGTVVDALVRGLEQGDNDSKLHLRSHVKSIDFSQDGNRATGLTLEQNRRRVVAREGVICNAPVWLLDDLIDNKEARRKLSTKRTDSDPVPIAMQSWFEGNDGYSIHLKRQQATNELDDSSSDVLAKCRSAEMTGSFLHLHVAIDTSALDLSMLEPHYTVMDRGLEGDRDLVVNGVPDGPCGELNMIAVSNPCVIDPSLAPPGYAVLHAYGAGNEPFGVWDGMNRTSSEYQALKEERSQVLWRALESVIPDIRDRVVLDLTGSPITHERFLRRPRGTYGAATEDYLRDGSTPISNFVLAGDSVFPGTVLAFVDF
jgi:phytoene dehydrogenase-like protein